VSLEIEQGEIVGVAALDGAATTLLQTIANRLKPLAGTVTLPERIGFVPENRKDEALIADFSLTENLALGDASSLHGVMDWKALADETAEVIHAFDVRTTSVDVSPAKLSGGNQQRFVLGRELRGNPPLLVLENPTQGLDLNAAHFVHERLRKARDNGAAVVFYSSDLDELADLSDRVIVVSRESVISVPADRDSIGRALLGAYGR
jgi:simple sugar transport system ATP-binding protein